MHLNNLIYIKMFRKIKAYTVIQKYLFALSVLRLKILTVTRKTGLHGYKKGNFFCTHHKNVLRNNE